MNIIRVPLKNVRQSGFGKFRNRLHPEVKDWLTNMIGPMCQGDHSVDVDGPGQWDWEIERSSQLSPTFVSFSFRTPTQAMLFKLAWSD